MLLPTAHWRPQVALEINCTLCRLTMHSQHFGFKRDKYAWVFVSIYFKHFFSLFFCVLSKWQGGKRFYILQNGESETKLNTVKLLSPAVCTRILHTVGSVQWCQEEMISALQSSPNLCRHREADMGQIRFKKKKGIETEANSACCNMAQSLKCMSWERRGLLIRWASNTRQLAPGCLTMVEGWKQVYFLACCVEKGPIPFRVSRKWTKIGARDFL